MWMRRGVSGGDSVCSRRERYGAPKANTGLGRSRSEDGSRSSSRLPLGRRASKGYIYIMHESIDQLYIEK